MKHPAGKGCRPPGGRCSDSAFDLPPGGQRLFPRVTDRESVLPVLDLIELALCFRQSIFVTTKEAQVFNEFAAGESRKDFEANVNTDFFGGGFKRLWLKRLWLNLAGEAGIPLARSRSADSAGLNVAFNPAVKMNGNVANLWIRNLG